MRTTARTIYVSAASCLMMFHAVADSSAPVATVDSTAISREQFELGVYNEARQTLYHGRPMTDERYLEFRKAVADKMIDRLLQLNEAKRRSISPDDDGIAAQLAIYEERYADTERWQTEGEAMLARVRKHLEEDSVLSIFEQQVRETVVPDQSAIRSYYDANPDKFTEPQRFRVSLILLAVAPSSSNEVWAAARSEGADLVQRIRDGESFGELARLHSADPSGKNDGDMGYVHAGMLRNSAQLALDALAVGELSDPVTVLEGIAVFRLTDRKEAKLRPFEDVRQRASDLLQREAGDNNWKQTIVGLRSQSDITIDEVYLQSLPERRQ